MTILSGFTLNATYEFLRRPLKWSETTNTKARIQIHKILLHYHDFWLNFKYFHKYLNQVNIYFMVLGIN